MTKTNRIPRPASKGFSLSVMPSREDLHTAIDQDGFCDCKNCWHKVAIAALFLEMDPDGLHKVRIDAGHVKLNYKGWRYIADVPNHVKRSLMLFDKKRYDEVRIREYNLRFRRTTKIKPTTRKRKDQINAAREARKIEGRPDRTNYKNIHARVEGFTALV